MKKQTMKRQTMKFLNIFKQKATIGNLLTISCSFIFAIALRYLYLHIFDYLPIKGELEVIDISYLTIVTLSRFIFMSLLEYLLDDTFHKPLFAHNIKADPLSETKKGANTLSMVDSDSKNSSKGSPSRSSSKGSPSKDPFLLEETEIEKEFHAKYPNFRKNVDRTPTAHDIATEAIWDKMRNVLKEQETTIEKLHNIKWDNDLKFYEEDGALSFSVPMSTSSTDANKLSKEIGKLDRGLQNKMLEYKNLCNKDIAINQSMWTEVNEGISEANKRNYKRLFEQSEKDK